MGDIAFNDTLRNNRAQQIINDLDKGVGAGYIELYGGGSGRPAKGAPITDQVLIGTLGLSKPCATITAGVLTFDVISDDTNADANEDIVWARFYDGDGAWVMDAGCGLSGSGKTLIFNTLTAKIGAIIQILSGSLTEGNG